MQPPTKQPTGERVGTAAQPRQRRMPGQQQVAHWQGEWCSTGGCSSRAGGAPVAPAAAQVATGPVVADRPAHQPGEKACLLRAGASCSLVVHPDMKAVHSKEHCAQLQPVSRSACAMTVWPFSNTILVQECEGSCGDRRMGMMGAPEDVVDPRDMDLTSLEEEDEGDSATVAQEWTGAGVTGDYAI